MWHVILFLALLVICCTYALVRGGAPERIGTAILLAGIGATALAASPSMRRFYSLELGIFLVDSAVVLSYLVLAIRANRHWPMWSTAVLAFGVVAHVAYWLDLMMIPKAYAAAQAFSGYPATILLAIGTYRHRRRLRANGTDSSWSTPSG